ncbi:MAG TPA: enoyl-CoA hydratase-related protein, partial [Dehalococcoidia bacterium]|nr:enoyl-CoA hydratase-related protein [Dehalococcoidia bacterium]
MPDFENLTYEKVGAGGRVARITLNRPEKMNSLSFELLQEFRHALEEAEDDPGVSVIVVRGAGRTFSAGYDLTPGPRRQYPAMQQSQRRSVSTIRTNMVRVSDFQLYLFNIAKPTIAQVHGYAIAGGLEFAMMHDIVIAAEDARFGHPGVRGLGTSRTCAILPLVVGMRKTYELMYTGDSIDAREAARIGLINAAVPADELEATTLRWAERIGIQTGDSLAVIKRSINCFYEAMGIANAVHTAT